MLIAIRPCTSAAATVGVGELVGVSAGACVGGAVGGEVLVGSGTAVSVGAVVGAVVGDGVLVGSGDGVSVGGGLVCVDVGCTSVGMAVSVGVLVTTTTIGEGVDDGRALPLSPSTTSVASVGAWTMAIVALRALKKHASEQGRKKRIDLTVHPKVASRLFNEDRGSIAFLEKRFRGKINIKPDPMLHIEEVKIEAV